VKKTPVKDVLGGGHEKGGRFQKGLKKMGIGPSIEAKKRNIKRDHRRTAISSGGMGKTRNV